MPKLNETEIKQILRIENRKRELGDTIDSAINELTHTRMAERQWWGRIVDKYKLNQKKLHRVWIDGDILEERRLSRGKRKVF